MAALRPAVLTSLLLLALPALAQEPGLMVAVRRCDPATTGFDPRQVDIELRQAFANAALAAGAEFVLAREFEANVIVSCKGAPHGDRYHLVFALETTSLQPVRDQAEIELATPRLSPAMAEAVVRLVVLRARALTTQQHLEAPEPAPIESAFEERTEEDTWRERPPPARTFGRVDLALSGGLNAPAGSVGGRLEVHTCQWFSVTMAAGYGTWGARVSPGFRLYPFGLRTLGLFLDGAVALSLGEPTTVTRGAGRETVDLSFTSSGLLAVGLRQQFLRYLAVDVFMGFAARFNMNNVRTRSSVPPDAALMEQLEPRQPGGLVAGASIGGSFF